MVVHTSILGRCLVNSSLTEVDALAISEKMNIKSNLENWCFSVLS